MLLKNNWFVEATIANVQVQGICSKPEAKQLECKHQQGKEPVLSADWQRSFAGGNYKIATKGNNTVEHCNIITIHNNMLWGGTITCYHINVRYKLLQ